MRHRARRTRWSNPFSWLLLLVVVVLTAVPAAADLAGTEFDPPTERVQNTHLVIDPGPYGAVMPRPYEIQAGDTLSELAMRHLGSMRHTQRLLDANPGLVAEQLTVGTTITIPPAAAALDPGLPETPDGPKHRWAFYVFTPTGSWPHIAPLPATFQVTPLSYTGTWLIAIRHDHRRDFEALLAKKPPPSDTETWLRTTFAPETTTRPPWAAVGPRAVARMVDLADPVHRVVDTRRITSIRDGVIHTERVHLRKYDEDGKVLSEAAIVVKRNVTAMVFILLGLIGFVLLVHVTMRRRRARGARVAPSPTATAAIVAALLVGATSPASADVPVPGRRNITTEVTLQFGPYAEYTTRVHVLKQGETADNLPTFGVPAGMPHEKIEELLEGVDMDALKPGQRLRLPPARTPLSLEKKETDPRPKQSGGRGPAMHWWDIYSIPSPSMELVPFGNGQKVPVLHYGTQVIAVRHDHDAAFRKAYAEPKTGSYHYLRTLEADPPVWFAKAKGIDAGRTSVKTASPVYRIEKTLRIKGIANGVIETELVSTAWYGKDGKQLTKAEIEAANRMGIGLLLLAAGGLGGLVVLLVRRGRARGSAAALLLAGTLVVGAAPAHADVRVGPPPPVQVEVAVLDAGALKDRALRTVRVEAGWTMKSMAKRFLGDEARWREIQALNPGAHPTELAPGYRMDVPPVHPDKEGAWQFFAVDGPRGHAWRAYPGEGASPGRADQATLVAVRADGLKAFQAKLKETEGTTRERLRMVPRHVGLERLAAKPPAWFAWAPDVTLRRHYLKEATPLLTIQRHVRVDGIEQGKLRTTVMRTRYLDRFGKEISPEEAAKQVARRKGVFVLLGLLGAGGLLLVVLRRRARVATAAA